MRAVTAAVAQAMLYQCHQDSALSSSYSLASSAVTLLSVTMQRTHVPGLGLTSSGMIDTHAAP